MAEPDSRGVDPAHLESLRRRLYRPDATTQDRRRFEELADAVEPVPAPSAPEATRPDPARRRSRTLVVLAAVAAGAVAVLLVTNRPSPAPQDLPTNPAAQAAVGASEIRAELVALQPDAPTATEVRTRLGGVRTRLQRFEGAGRTVVAIDTSGAQQVNGTLLVMLTAMSADAVGWSATRPTRQPGHSQYVEVVASGTADPVDASPAYGMHAYDGSPPSRLLISAPDGDRWTLTIAFLPRGQSEQ